MMLNLFVAVTCLALVTSSPFRESDGALRRKDASRVQLFSAKSETEKKQLFSVTLVDLPYLFFMKL